jgi:nucleotide-binding universal stress UspA family protein
VGEETDELRRPAAVPIDLLVMGVYDHSPPRQRVLSGVSREMLRAMTVPILMSHG